MKKNIKNNISKKTRILKKLYNIELNKNHKKKIKNEKLIEIFIKIQKKCSINIIEKILIKHLLETILHDKKFIYENMNDTKYLLNKFSRKFGFKNFKNTINYIIFVF